MRPEVVRRHVLAVSLLVLAAAVSACQRPAPTATSASASDSTVDYVLGPAAEVQRVYPDQSWLPGPYKPSYPDLSATIELFTKLSLDHDGIPYTSVEAELAADAKTYHVTIHSSDPAARAYATIHPRWVENYVAALQGVDACMAKEGCWDPDPQSQEPWAFFPQFTLPMANQKSVLMLNFPPVDALTKKSYLGTFTMMRWSSVYQSAGITDPTLFEPIMDVRPIAAPASGSSSQLPNAQTYFNDKDGKTGGYYITPQLNLLLDPPSNAAQGSTLPLVVLGTPARQQWKAMTGLSDALLTTGRTTLPGAGKSTSFILGNHPDVTTYQCCPGDPSSECDSFDLVPDEQIDLTIACWAKTLGADPSLDPDTVKETCEGLWSGDLDKLPEHSRFEICVRARMDNDACFDQHVTREEAVEYCQQYDENPCATFSCTAGSD